MLVMARPLEELGAIPAKYRSHLGALCKTPDHRQLMPMLLGATFHLNPPTLAASQSAQSYSPPFPLFVSNTFHPFSYGHNLTNPPAGIVYGPSTVSMVQGLSYGA